FGCCTVGRTVIEFEDDWSTRPLRRSQSEAQQVEKSEFALRRRLVETLQHGLDEMGEDLANRSARAFLRWIPCGDVAVTSVFELLQDVTGIALIHGRRLDRNHGAAPSFR